MPHVEGVVLDVFFAASPEPPQHLPDSPVGHQPIVKLAPHQTLLRGCDMHAPKGPQNPRGNTSKQASRMEQQQWFGSGFRVLMI